MLFEFKLATNAYNTSMNISGCQNATTCTLVLRGGSEQFLEETERSLHDAIMIVRRTIKNDSVVAGKFAIFFIVSHASYRITSNFGNRHFKYLFCSHALHCQFK